MFLCVSKAELRFARSPPPALLDERRVVKCFKMCSSSGTSERWGEGEREREAARRGKRHTVYGVYI